MKDKALLQAFLVKGKKGQVLTNTVFIAGYHRTIWRLVEVWEPSHMKNASSFADHRAYVSPVSRKHHILQRSARVG